MEQKRFGFIKNKKFLVIAAAVLAVVLVTAGVYWAVSGKTAREFYFNAESKNFGKYADLIKKTYKDLYESQQPYLSGAYKRRTEVTADIKSGDGKFFGLDNAQSIFDIVKRCKLVTDTKRNPVDGTSLSDVSLLLEKTPFVDATVFSKDRQLFFTVPVLTPDRYFSINEDRFDEVYDRFNIPVRPKRILNLADVTGAIKFDDKEFDKVAADYGSYLSQMIGESNVKYGKNVEMTVSGQKAVGREVFVTLDGDKSTRLLKGLAAKAGSDDALLKLTYGNFADVSGMLSEAGVFQLFDYLDKTGTVVLNASEKNILNTLNIKKNVEGFKKTLVDAVNGYELPEGLQMRLVIDSSGNILDRKTTTVVRNVNNQTEYTVDIHTGSNSLKYNDAKNRLLDIGISPKASAGKNYRQFLKISTQYAPSARDGDGTGNVEVSYGTDAEGVVQSATTVRLDLNSLTDTATLKKTSTVKYSIDMQGTSPGKKDLISGDIKTISWQNNKLKTRNWNTVFTVNADLPTFGVEGVSAVLNLAREDKLGLEPFKLPEIQEADTINLNTASKEELDKVQNEILASFGTFYLTNKPIIDAIIPK